MDHLKAHGHHGRVASTTGTAMNDALRRAISTQAEGTKLLESHDVAPSAARLVAASRRITVWLVAGGHGDATHHRSR